MKSHHPTCLHLNSNGSHASTITFPLYFSPALCIASMHIVAELHLDWKNAITITFTVWPLLHNIWLWWVDCDVSKIQRLNALSLNDSWCDKSHMINVHCSLCHFMISDRCNVSSSRHQYSISLFLCPLSMHTTQTHTQAQRSMSALHAFCICALRARGL